MILQWKISLTLMLLKGRLPKLDGTGEEKGRRVLQKFEHNLKLFYFRDFKIRVGSDFRFGWISGLARFPVWPDIRPDNVNFV